MVVSKDGGCNADICLHLEKMEQVVCFRYLGADIHKSGRLGEETGHRVRKGEKVGGALRAIWKCKEMSVGAMKGMSEAIVLPTLTYGNEAWVIHAREWGQVKVVKMRYLRA